MDVRIYSDACATGAGLTPGKLFGTDFTVRLRSKAHPTLFRCLEKTDEPYGLGLVAMVAAVRALSEQLRGKRTKPFLATARRLGPLRSWATTQRFWGR